MTNMALFSVYGLLFGGQLQQWGLETTGVAFISSTMTSVQNFSGESRCPCCDGALSMKSSRILTASTTFGHNALL